MQPRPIAETIGPPRPSFRCFIFVKIRRSSSLRLRNRQAMTIQGFSIRRCLDVETQVSRHATFVVENLLPCELHRLYRRALGDQGDEDAHEPGGCVRYANDTRPSSSDFPSARRNTQVYSLVRAMKTRSFV